MQKLSTGEDSTLGNHRKMPAAVFGEQSGAVLFLDEKIAASPRGESEEVIIDEKLMTHLLSEIHLKGEVTNDTNQHSE